MTLWERVVQANRPGPAEHSIPFRVASTGTVVIAVAACWSQGELSPAVTVFAIVATIVGNLLSYLRRTSPWPAVKPILAVCAVGGFVWFIATVSHNATPGDISTVEGPLAVLFAWVLCTHAFDVPARRDVAYSLAGSAALMAVAAAQSVDLSLGIYVVAWLVCGLWCLVAMWQSMAGSEDVPWLTLGVAGLAVAVVAALLLAVLPAPKVSTSLIFPSSSANSSPVDSPSNLTDGAASLPAHAASPTGKTGVGGFLGFAKSLDTGVRATLGNEVVLRVRASRPSFWVGQTYDTWNGQSWIQTGQPTSGGTSTSWSPGPRSTSRRPATNRPTRSPAPPTCRRSTWPSRGQTWSSTPTTPSGSTSSPRRSSSPGTAPSCRPPRWARAPCTRWSRTTPRPAPHSCASRRSRHPGRRPPTRSLRPSSSATSSSPTPTRGWRPWPTGSPPGSTPRREPEPTPTTRWRPSRHGWPTT